MLLLPFPYCSMFWLDVSGRGEARGQALVPTWNKGTQYAKRLRITGLITFDVLENPLNGDIDV